MTDKTKDTAVAALAENAVKTRFEDLDKETIETDQRPGYRHRGVRYWRRQCRSATGG